MDDYRDFLFYDEETGEEFLVEICITGKRYEESLKEAESIAYENFNKPIFQEILTVEDGEWLGLDTY